MIAFRKGHEPYGHKQLLIPKDQLKQLINAIIESGHQFTEGSYHGDLSPTQIEMVISHLLYNQNHSSVTMTIDKETDGYHLGLTIDAIRK